MFGRYLDEALNNVSFDDTRADQQMKLDKLLSYGLASELQCLRCCLVSLSLIYCRRSTLKLCIIFDNV